MSDLMLQIISRRDAASRGMKRYFTGIPCPAGHISERLVSASACMDCRREHSRSYYKQNREEIIAQKKSYQAERRDQILEKKREYYAKNSERLILEKREWEKKNPYLAKMQKKRWQERFYSKPQGKATVAIRKMLSRMINCKNPKGSEKAIGYSSSDLVRNIESKFSEGMTWDNYGEWHIDHKKPISAFIQEGITDPKVINALDNLQPLWAIENLKKGAKYNSGDDYVD